MCEKHIARRKSATCVYSDRLDTEHCGCGCKEPSRDPGVRLLQWPPSRGIPGRNRLSETANHQQTNEHVEQTEEPESEWTFYRENTTSVRPRAGGATVRASRKQVESWALGSIDDEYTIGGDGRTAGDKEQGKTIKASKEVQEKPDQGLQKTRENAAKPKRRMEILTETYQNGTQIY